MMKNAKKDEERLSADVAIIGGGPVGMAVAATVARFGLSVVLIEQSSGTTPYSKAIGVHAITLENMHTLGLTDGLLAEGFPMRDYAIYENKRRTMATSFRGIATPYDFVLGLPQSRTEAHLAADLEKQGVSILWEHKLTEIRDIGALKDPNWPAQIVVEKPDGTPMTISASYVVGADGGRSTTRELVGIDFPGGSYGKAFLLGDVKLDWNGPRHELQFHLSKHGYLLLIPMPNGMHRVIAQTDLKWEDFQDRHKRPEAKLGMLQDIIDTRGPGGIRAHSPEWLTAAPFYYRLASSAHRERVFLAGDAMHLVSPLGAQGLNTGFGDAFNLGWKLGFVHQGMADVSLLESYGTERLKLAASLIDITTKTTRYITATRWWERLARSVATSFMNPGIKVQRDLPALLSGIRQAYDPSVLAGKMPSAAWPEPGSRAPNARLQSQSGLLESARLFHGQAFHAIFVLRRVDDMMLGQVQAEVTRLLHLGDGVRPVVILREYGDRLPSIQGAQVLADPFADLTGEIGTAQNASFLVRPDGVVAASCSELDAGLTLDYFASAPWAKPATAEKELRHVA